MTVSRNGEVEVDEKLRVVTVLSHRMQGFVCVPSLPALLILVEAETEVAQQRNGRRACDGVRGSGSRLTIVVRYDVRIFTTEQTSLAVQNVEKDS